MQPGEERFAVRLRAALSKEAEKHSAQDSSFKETLTALQTPGTHVLQGMPPASTLSHPHSNCWHSRGDSQLTKEQKNSV